MITKLAARGVREKDIARAVDVSEPTWLSLKRDFPEVQAAVDAGRQVMHDALVGKLYEKAMAGDTIALLFAMKVMFGYRENEPPQDTGPRIEHHVTRCRYARDLLGAEAPAVSGDRA